MGKSNTISSEERVSDCISLLQTFVRIPSPSDINCPSLVGDRQCRRKITITEGDGIVDHATLLLRLLQTRKGMSMDDNLEKPDSSNSASLSLEQLVDKVTHCSSHKTKLIAAILDCKPGLSRPITTPTDIEPDAENDNPSSNESLSTPLKKEHALQHKTLDSLSSHYISRLGEAAEVARTITTKTPERKQAATTLQRPPYAAFPEESPFEDSPFSIGSSSSSSIFTATPQSTFSVDNDNVLTPLTPPSTGPKYHTKYSTSADSDSPVSRRTRQNLAKRRGDHKVLGYFPPLENENQESEVEEEEAQEIDSNKRTLTQRALFTGGVQRVAVSNRLVKYEEENIGGTLRKPAKLSVTPEESHGTGAKNPVLLHAAPSIQDGRPRAHTQLASCQPPKLSPFSTAPSRHKIFELIERNFGAHDNGVGYIYIAVHSSYSPAAPGDKRLFKIGTTTNSIKDRYTSEKCKHVTHFSMFVARSETAFRGARRAEQLALADLSQERRYLKECDYCNSKSGKKGTHTEWVVATEERVREAVDRWTRFVQLESVYVNGQLSSMAQDYLAEILVPAGLVARLESRAGVEPKDRQKQNLIVFEEPQLMVNADAAVDKAVRLRELIKENQAKALAHPSAAGDEATRDSSIRNSVESEISRDASMEARRTQKTSRKSSKEKPPLRGWDLVVDALKPKSGLKLMKEAMRRSSMHVVEVDEHVKGGKEPKVGLVRRATGQFFKAK